MGCGEGAGSAAEAQLQKSLLAAEQEQGVQTPGYAKRGFSPPRSSHSGDLQKQATQLSESVTLGLHLSPPSSSFLFATQGRGGLALVFSPGGNICFCFHC